jgi:aldehyde:ferredoxin oxidoreductase
MGMTNLGGYWAAELKYAGYDHLAITGRSPNPVYLLVRDDEVEIRDASSVWGKDTYEVTPLIRRELKELDVQVVMIGQAGESLVRYASVLTKVGDAAGKTGMGGVMGSKNLKAVAVRGTGGVKVVDPDAFYKVCEETHALLRSGPYYEGIVAEGTAHDVPVQSRIGLRNFGNNLSSVWPEGQNVDEKKWVADHRVKRAGCFCCPLRCMDQEFVPDIGASVLSCVGYIDTVYKGMNSDLDVWYEAEIVCQRYGMDFVNFYATVAWAADLYSRGIITDADTDGIPFVLGTREFLLPVMQKIVKREGIGDLLADGPYLAARRLGRGSDALVYHTKKAPHGSANCWNLPLKALSTAVGPRSDMLLGDGGMLIGGEGDMLKDAEGPKTEYKEWIRSQIGDSKAAESFGYEGKAKLVAHMEKAIAVTDIMLHCKWHGPWMGMPVEADALAKVLSVGTGEGWTGADLMKVGARVRCLERAFEAREGITRQDDSMPSKYFTDSLPGRFPDARLDQALFEKMKSEYYEIMGWDVATGTPTRQTLEQLNMQDVADDLAARGCLPVPVPAEVIVR